MLRHVAALVFIFVCTTIAWMILGSTIMYRTQGSDEQLRGRVGSTWGTQQEQAPPTATYTQTEQVSSFFNVLREPGGQLYALGLVDVAHRAGAHSVCAAPAL